MSEAINKAKKAGEDASKLIAEAKDIPKKIKDVEADLDKAEVVMRNLLRKVPNIMHKDVPFGKGEEDNPKVKKWGDIKKFSFPIKNHVELCEELGLANFEVSAQTSGSGFYFLKGDLALLNQALIQFAINKMLAKGYNYVEPPLMVRKHILDAAMDTEGFEETIYTVGKEEEKPENQLCMIGTAEHVILGMHEGETIEAEK
ncbi:serine--tRNA ligase, partial [Candidatus Woesearchaeota archaeon]|nr:serine--tRNA ligase [Candidatus Woesearchaeota archaeon]